MRKLLGLGMVLLCSCGGPPKTRAEACYRWATTTCSKAIACDLFSAEFAEPCRIDTAQDCCTGAACEAVLTKAQVDFFYSCDAALNAETCAQVASPHLPTACK